ncbi:hypothetical protein [Frankia sp. QA3]|uniref:hypothetical protein n=1 Tax=Frankia sp. QA3 TaxID=710111 RepID=UPI000269BEF9|nr:hypothetical protein [Frankia sp. QA3]EIV92709.1 hypothetical protein FraQA3DRAFT_2319 [Frankia sp. QA3]
MTRTDAMASRLPAMYDTRPGTLLTRLLDQMALPLEKVDDERLAVQRAHWLPTAVDRADIGKLGALLDRRLEDWENTALFRVRLVAIARARLAGAVTAGPILGYVEDLLRAGRLSLGLDVAAAAGGARAVLVENPPLTGRTVVGPMTPLDRFTATNDGLDPTVLEANLVALPGTRAATPVLAVPGTGYLLGWAGVIPAGSRLHLRWDAEAKALTADLDGADRTAMLFSVADFEPGKSLTAAQLRRPAEPLRLPVGTTTVWYVTAGLFDRPELDAVMFAVAREALRQGRFDQDGWDDALMYQPPPLWGEFFWTSPAPASFDVHVPAGVLAADRPLWPDREQARERLGLLAAQGVEELRAAGVRARTDLVPLREVMPLRDRVTVGEGLLLVDGAPAAGSPVPEFGALLDGTPMDHSRLE